jgi:hypothetical protein
MNMVDLVGWNTLLFASKWLFIGLIYFALFIILIAVRRELSYRVESRQPVPVSATGRLKVLEPGADTRFRAGTIIDLAPETVLGAEQGNDIVLSDTFVSGRHARLSWDGSTWWVEDLGSRNGTLVDRQQCLPHSPQVLPPGGVLQLGDMTFQLLA